MKICIVGSLIKDVYLNLDTRAERFETDKHNTKWLDIAFNASEHKFFHRDGMLAGVAVSLEALAKMGIDASVAGTDLRLEEDGMVSHSLAAAYRYILVAKDGGKGDSDDDRPEVSYFVPFDHPETAFVPPDGPVDYLFIDRSANLSRKAISDIVSYLDISANTTKLALYLKEPDNIDFRPLIDRADLIFLEDHAGQTHNLLENTVVAVSTTSDGGSGDGNNAGNATDSQRLRLSKPALSGIPPEKIVRIADSRLLAGSISKSYTADRVDLQTHLSIFSIAAATILGAVALGKPLETALNLAIANIENSRLNSCLTLEDLENIIANTFTPLPRDKELELIAANLMLRGKGILAADESGGSIEKKFAQLNIPDTYQNRRDYRNIFFTTPHLEDYVNGVILFDETTKQFADNGQNFVDFLTSRRIIPGIKVDQGLEPLPGTADEKYTKGLDGLTERLAEYYHRGLRFAKWRAAFNVQLSQSGQILTPSEPAIMENCRILAEYALACQRAGLVPIVEPELVYDGYYSVDQSASLTGHILDVLFEKLADRGVNPRACILKTNMVLAGKQFGIASTPVEVGQETARVLRKHVPHDLAGIVFLSGGQTPEQATANLAEISKNGPYPWNVTFSFARALQDPALYAWQGNNANVDQAQKAFLERLKANAEALFAVDF